MSDSLQEEASTQPSYLHKYGLTREPFAVSPDSNQDVFFLLDSERAQRLNMLYHMCQNSELLLVVSGIQGSGKTSLLNKFIDMRTDNWRQCVINATATTNPDQLLIEIAEGFGLPQDSVNFGSGLEMLQKRLTEMKRSELMPILIIDDAHQLPTASLTILLKLSELSDADERLLRIVLFGEPAINDMFNAPELKEVKHRITHTLTMPSLDEKQTIEYIQYRLSVAGLQGENPFSSSQMKRIHRQANGMPGLINQFSQNILLGSMSNNNDRPGFTSRLRSGITVLLILGIAATITWLLSRDVIESLGNSQSNRETHDLPLLPPSKKLPASTQMPKSSTSIQTMEFDAISGGNESEIIKETQAPQSSDTNSVSQTGAQADNPAVNTTVKPDIKIVTKPTAEAVAKPTTKTVTKPVAEAIAKPVIKPTAKPASKTVIKPVTKPTVETKPKQPTVKKSWLLLQNPEDFTLQIMGSRKRSSLTLVQKAHKLSSKSAIVRTQLKGADWYILIYNSYSSKQQARDAVKTLPKALQLTQPWPRSLGELKNLK